MLGLLEHGRWRRLNGALIGLRLSGRRSDRQIELPVMYAQDGDALWVAVGHPERKTWWRNVSRGSSVQVLRDGVWLYGVAQLVAGGDDRFEEGRTAYASRWPRADLAAGDPLVLITRVRR